jgi:hypothetical protein
LFAAPPLLQPAASARKAIVMLFDMVIPLRFIDPTPGRMLPAPVTAAVHC